MPAEGGRPTGFYYHVQTYDNYPAATQPLVAPTQNAEGKQVVIANPYNAGYGYNPYFYNNWYA